MTLFSRNVILKDFKIYPRVAEENEPVIRFPKDGIFDNKLKVPEGLGITHRIQEDNRTDHATLQGTKKQINEYIRQVDDLGYLSSERLRTLNNLPRFRQIGTKMERIQ